ncbi:M56 family metallopeptidase [Polaribacter ponticola]|uniref:M56 family metallopeptidase n=1 Tax=Polaribacter ponticola TaxID=2978475 RepID=A0ABT5SBJ4_9FLAO|nr:M56 family metallopeptidase [Polaribacter sp. MSW5]MDD7914836.1 M56 family metallopeptidase [Polaribacter sp. MSW5]
MINYILQVILFQVLFLAIYDFFLSKETFFIKNRWYLLSTPVLSFLIPFIKIPTFQKEVPQQYIVYLPELILSPEKVIQNVITETSFYQSINYISILFWIGVAVFSILFFIKLVKIFNLIRKNEAQKLSDFTLILIPNQTKAFSFFNYVFLGKEITESKRTKIIEHELVHSKQKHSLDLLFFEFLKIAMWFNPMIYFYQKRITLVHEYISDSIVAKSESKDQYINNLLSNFFQVENISFINQFHKNSLIKKRILMMTKNKSKKMNQLKYLVLIPVLASMLFYSSCSENSSEKEISSEMKLQSIYRSSKGRLFSFKGNKETYLDSYFGDEPPEEVEEILFQNLSKNEQEEFNVFNRRLIAALKKILSLKTITNLDFLECQMVGFVLGLFLRA